MMKDKTIDKITEKLYNIENKFRGHSMTEEQFEKIECAVNKLRSCYLPCMSTTRGSKMTLDIVKQAIEAKSRKLGANWCIEIFEETPEDKYNRAMRVVKD